MITALAALLCGASCLPLLAAVLLRAADCTPAAWLATAAAVALMSLGTDAVDARPLPLVFAIAGLACLIQAYRAARRTDRETRG